MDICPREGASGLWCRAPVRALEHSPWVLWASKGRRVLGEPAGECHAHVHVHGHASTRRALARVDGTSTLIPCRAHGITCSNHMHMHMPQATIYDAGCLALTATPRVATISIDTPNIHMIPFTALSQVRTTACTHATEHASRPQRLLTALQARRLACGHADGQPRTVYSPSDAAPHAAPARSLAWVALTMTCTSPRRILLVRSTAPSHGEWLPFRQAPEARRLPPTAWDCSPLDFLSSRSSLKVGISDLGVMGSLAGRASMHACGLWSPMAPCATGHRPTSELREWSRNCPLAQGPSMVTGTA